MATERQLRPGLKLKTEKGTPVEIVNVTIWIGAKKVNDCLITYRVGNDALKMEGVETFNRHMKDQ